MRRLALFLISLCLALPVLAADAARPDRKEDFGDVTVHYSAFTSSMLQPDIAAATGLTRSKNQGVLNIALIKAGKPSMGVVSGTVKDLTGRSNPLSFKQITDQGAVYYIAQFKIEQAETLTFDLNVETGGVSHQPGSVPRRMMNFQQLVLASHNAGKLKELQAMLGQSVQLRSIGEFSQVEPEETGLSFVENAILKARNAARISGLPALADDSGLAVDFLGGAPGIYSARYAEGKGDAANNAKLLEALKDVPQEQRGAQFVCVLALVRHADDPLPILCEGLWQGRILFEASGEHGFGYDPLFWVPERNCSSADLSPADKNQLSHRARAMALLRQRLGLA